MHLVPCDIPWDQSQENITLFHNYTYKFEKASLAKIFAIIIKCLVLFLNNTIS